MPAKHDLCRSCKEFGKTYVCEKCVGCEDCCKCDPVLFAGANNLWLHRDSRRGLQLIKKGTAAASD